MAQSNRTVPRYYHALVAVVLLSTLIAPVANAQDRGNSGWSLRLAPYLWYSNIGGSEDLGVPPDEQHFGELVIPVEDTLLQRDWMVRAEIGKGRIRGWVNVSRAGIANDTEMIREGDPTDTIPGDYDLDWFTTEAFVTVHVGTFARANSVEIYGGGRFARHRQTVTLQGGSPSTITESWIEPVIGSRLFVEMGRRFWAAFNTDIGGFSVGSEFTWTLGGELGLRVVGPLDLAMRYNYQEVEYDNGKEGSELYRWSNGVQQGWFFGLVLKL
jgi:hypothetical protein